MVELFVCFFVKCHSQIFFDQIITTSLPETACKSTSTSRIFDNYDILAMRVFLDCQTSCDTFGRTILFNRFNVLDRSQKRSTFFVNVDMLYIVDMLSSKLY